MPKKSDLYLYLKGSVLAATTKNLTLMKKTFLILTLLIAAYSCTQKPQTQIAPWVPFDETAELAENADHDSARMRFRLIQSQVRDKNHMLETISAQLKDFSPEDYQRLTPLILEQSIPVVQERIREGELTYKELTQWFLYRIALYENDRNTMLNAVIAINPTAVEEARQRDKRRSDADHPIYGMPILVKDNINVGGMPSSAGSHLLKDNVAPDAEIIRNIKERGGIILGKTNLSEWANYLFAGGPNGFSAVGGQTLNAYGRRIYDTGGSSSGSGVAMAANFAMAAIGTETSGSILSPSGKSSLVGLKPTVGLLSTGGIIPLSSTLDTPGPMTRCVVDNAILYSAMGGGNLSAEAGNGNNFLTSMGGGDEALEAGASALKTASLEGVRFGVIKPFLADSLYRLAESKIVALGGTVVEFDPVAVDLTGFGDLLSADMKADLPLYLEEFAESHVVARSIRNIIDYNREDSLIRIPYGQAIFEDMAQVSLSAEELALLRERLQSEGRRFFDTPMDEHRLDAILSIDNLTAGQAAVAKYPCITVPM
ncbi:MAG: amidase family protein, partial [Bacilli bacterium]